MCLGCQKQTDKIIVGTFGAMTGSEATFGRSSYNGIILALEEKNAQGGVLKKPLFLKSYDDQGNVEDAKVAVEKLITIDEVKAIIGESASSRSIGAAPIAQSYKVPMISPSSTNPKLTQIGDYIFRACFIDPFQGEVVAKFAVQKLNLKKAAILSDKNSDYSQGLADFFKRKFTDLGGEVVAEEKFVSGDVEFGTQLKTIREKKPDFIFVPAYYTEVGVIARQARNLSIKIPFMGGDGWDSDLLTKIGKDALEGSFFTNHYTPQNPAERVQSFVSRYKKRFDEIPDSQAASAYDAANMLFMAIETAGSTDGVAIKKALSEINNFPGVTGNISINKERDAVKSAVILQVKGNSFHYVMTIEP